jgi:hypothetical protein
MRARRPRVVDWSKLEDHWRKMTEKPPAGSILEAMHKRHSAADDWRVAEKLLRLSIQEGDESAAARGRALVADADRKKWQATHDALRAALRQRRGGADPEPLPAMILEELADCLYDIAYAGKMPRAWAALSRQSGAVTIERRRWQRAAVAYVHEQWRRLGKIAQPSPKNEVIKLFGITRRAVDEWCRDPELQPDEDWPNLPYEDETDEEERERLSFLRINLEHAARQWRRGIGRGPRS